ncbi:hypothetical protein QFC20_002069 [Naganishia adeliensis]|uniref:Uncharacterized protein n=1 Tax=Naganishia adeliensis TaxID=92952 RepID=A0ACC2WNF8_9TREE|nr:hypothetical protein QFC20_002069 [Naganishia adeliensis]
MKVNQLMSYFDLAWSGRTPGYNSLDDLEDVNAGELARDLKITVESAQEVLTQADYRRAGPSSSRPRSQLPTSQSQSAATLLRREAVRSAHDQPVTTAWSTGSHAIDHLLLPPPFIPWTPDAQPKTTRGVRPGMVLEVASPPGMGKSSLLLRVAQSARTAPHPVDVLLVDTEGGLLSPPKLRNASPQVLNGIHGMRISTQAEMIAFWYTLEQWLLSHPSVLIANQMATKLLTASNKPASTFDTGDRAILMPQLGDLWVTPRTLRLSLFRSGPDGTRGVWLKGADAVGRYAHIQAQAGEKGERPWAAFEVDEHGLVVDVEREGKDAEA